VAAVGVAGVSVAAVLYVAGVLYVAVGVAAADCVPAY